LKDQRKIKSVVNIGGGTITNEVITTLNGKPGKLWTGSNESKTIQGAWGEKGDRERIVFSTLRKGLGGKHNKKNQNSQGDGRERIN